LKGIQHAFVVVDDSSPDGTGELVRKIAETPLFEGETIHLLTRARKLGLGSAYREAVEFVYNALEPERANSSSQVSDGGDTDSWIAILDADLQHDPYDVPRLLKQAKEQNLDVCYGSRYIDGGGVVNWKRSRVFVSTAANCLTRNILGLQCTDCTSSLRIYKLNVLQEALKSSRASGFAIQVELIAYCESAGKKVGSVPIVFEEREAGGSKFSLRESVLFLKLLAGLVLKA